MNAPGRRGVRVGQRVGQVLLYSGWSIKVHAKEQVPPTGPVILAPNHANFVDGPLVLTVSPRPLHCLVKREMFVGPIGPLLRGFGQIPVDRGSADRHALLTALAVLEEGRALGVFPEGTRGSGTFEAVQQGLAWLALRSEALIVPVACLGVASRGRTLASLPPFRSRLDVVFGAPFRLDNTSGRSRAALAAASEQLRERLVAHLSTARSLVAPQTGSGTDHEENA